VFRVHLVATYLKLLLLLILLLLLLLLLCTGVSGC
jgi:hypothetical protein